MTAPAMDGDYEARVANELHTFADTDAETYALPPIVSTWSLRSVLPLIREAGYGGIDEMWQALIAEQCRRCAPRHARLVSLGAGAAETELGIAKALADEGIENLDLVLLELSGEQVQRAAALAAELGLGGRVVAAEADLNVWTADGLADVYFANQSLHHIVELEHLFAEVRRSLAPDGVFLVNDMIGRNGHVRWPEAADLVHRIWNSMPERHRWNRFVEQTDTVYPDPDYSAFGFEGVRSQDVLPLLLDAFHPEVFLAFGNVIDPFIDRAYGWSRDPDNEEDRDFIDAVARLDDAAVDLGLVSPTHLLAAFRTRPVEIRCPRMRPPERMVRRPDPDEDGPAQDAEALQASADEAWSRYHALRSRKAVRAALRITELGHAAAGAARRRLR